MTTKSREYVRELNTKDIQYLKERYHNHIKPIRDGFLNTRYKKLLLQTSKWDPHTSDRDVYDFFYEIRERAKSAMLDLELLCDTLNEEQLKEIFTSRLENPKGAVGDYLIVRVLRSIIPTPIHLNRDRKYENLVEKEWRKTFLAEVMGMTLIWYYYSGIFQTTSHKNLIFETLDAIEFMSTGKRNYANMIEQIKKGLDMEPL